MKVTFKANLIKILALSLCCITLLTGCTKITNQPSNNPQQTEINNVTKEPTKTNDITNNPTFTPEVTEQITEFPTDIPTNEPTVEPTIEITNVPTITPTVSPTSTPKPTSTSKPTNTPVPTNTPKPTLSWTEEEIDPCTKYTTHSLNLRTEPDSSLNNVILTMSYGSKVTAIAHTNNNWYKVKYTKNNTEYVGYCSGKYLSNEKPESNNNWTYPLRYSDSTMTITVYKEWYRHAYVYSAHIQFTDYKRVGMYNANGKYHSYCTTSQAAKQLNAILCVNGDYANADCFGLPFARQGKVYNDKIECWAVGFYNNHNGKLFLNGWGMPTHGRRLSEMVEEGIVTDTINFYYSVIVKNGQNQYSSSESNSNDRRPRTFIGTNEQPGDIWVFVADGDHRDGKSVGLNSWERAEWALSKGCTLCFGMDGGGSSTMVFRGHRLTGGNHSERAVVDFFFAR